MPDRVSLGLSKVKRLTSASAAPQRFRPRWFYQAFFCSLFLLLGLTASSQAATFVVNTTQDTDDGICGTNSNGCSLRDAITRANSNGTANTINFNIPTSDSGYSSATGVYTLTLTSNDLPGLAASTTIDATTVANTNTLGPEIEVTPGSNYGYYGLYLSSGGCTVKGLILNGFSYPIYISSNSNTVQKCYIGTDRTGTTASPNNNVQSYYYTGVYVNGTGNVIGGTSAGVGNTIGFANGDGVTVYGTTNSVRGNASFGNGDLGIDLGDDGVTDNDLGDADTGNNNLQNFPAITSVTTSGGNTVVAVSLNSEASKTYGIDLFRIPTAEIDDSGFGQAKAYVSSTSLTTNASGNGTASFTFTGTFPSDSFTATATDPTGNTSEFGFATNSVAGSVVTSTADSGVGSLRSAIFYTYSYPGSSITFKIPNTDTGFDGTTYNIQLLSDLPTLGSGVTIDGTTQTTNVGNSNANGPEVQISDNGNYVYSDLTLSGSNTVKGLIINGGVYYGINTGSTNGNTVQGCYIGTDPTGTAVSPYNGTYYPFYYGVYIAGSNNTIGGTGAGQGNHIGFSGYQGVVIASGGTSNSVRGNAIFSNGQLGIDIDQNGVTYNDTGDADTGTNNLQNYPAVTSALTSGANTGIGLALNSEASKTYNIDVYRIPPGASDLNQFGGGDVYLGSTTITTNASGSGTGSLTLVANYPTGTAFSATATDAAGNTSEFGQYITLGENNPNIVRTTADNTIGCLRYAIDYANAYPGTAITFNIPTTDAGYNSATGVFSVILASDLPTITLPNTSIDGSSQTTFTGNTNTQGPEIEITNGGSPVSYGFYFAADNGSTGGAVKNLIINGVSQPIRIDRDSVTVQGNYIGTDRTGTVASPNNGTYYGYDQGVYIANGSNNIIGGTGAGQPNKIAFATNYGVNVGSGAGTGNKIRANSIFGNGGLGIDIGDTGVQANDSGDADTGPNNLQNFPIITAVTTASGNTSVALSLNSEASKTYTIDVFRSPSANVDPSGYGEGQFYVGSTTIATNASGSGTATLSVTGTYPTDYFTATATSPTGDTSEFSFAFQTGAAASNIVKNTKDSGSGSLRAALNFAASTPGTTVTFNIPTTDTGYNATTGVFTIASTTDLPTISGAGTIVDGASQTTYTGNTNTQGPEIELSNGGNPVNYGLHVSSTGSSVKNLIVNGSQYGISVGGSGNTVQGNYLGTDRTGTVASANNGTYYTFTIGLLLDSYSSGNIIGGTSAGQGNKIAFASAEGINASYYAAGNTIRGNSIWGNGALGIDLDGNGITANDLGDGDNLNQNYPLITSVTTSGGNTSVALSLNSEASKTYSIDLYRSPVADADPSGFGEGKTYAGSVSLTTDSSGNGTATATISGSIGTDVITATATDPDGNTSEFSYGAAIGSASPLVVINTNDSGAGSLRSAMTFANNYPGSTVTFNIPTTDSGYSAATGVWTIAPTSNLPSLSEGVIINGTTQPGNTNAQGPEIEVTGINGGLLNGFVLGGSDTIKGLIINGFFTPINITSSGNNTVESCYIGTDRTGKVTSSNNAVNNTYNQAIYMYDADNNTIGGDTAAKGNVIGFASNPDSWQAGIIFDQYNDANTIRYNTILGNQGAGIYFNYNDTGNTIRDNSIHDNGADGIGFYSTNYSVQNTIRYNSIYNNGDLGIDLGDDGVTANDPGQANTYYTSNHGQNYPVLTSVTASGATVTVGGTFNSRPNATYDLDFYGNTAADASGNGEGRYYLDTVSVTTDDNGDATFTKALTNVKGLFISATATVTDNPNDGQYNGDTSEFSNNLAVPVNVKLSASTYAVNENGTAATISVVRQGSISGAVSVNYATSNGTTNPATAGSDYTAKSGTLTWADGDNANKTITVPITNDTVDEVDETFNVTLSSPTGATLVAPTSAVVTILDDDTSNITVNDVAISEGNSGTKTLAFTVSLSTANSRDVTVNYATADGTTNPATAGSDYVATSGTLTIPAGSTSGTVGVTLNGDTTPEPNETLLLNLSGATNATITDAQGVATITNDDNNPPVNVSINPSFVISTYGTAKTFSAVYTDLDGYANISNAQLLINGTLNSANGLYVSYDAPTNKLYLKNDAGTALIGGFAPGSANTITNSQGSLNCAATTIGRSGNNLTVNWNVTPTQAFIGTKNLYLYVKDAAGATDGFDDLGDWVIKASTNSVPLDVSIAPASSANIVGTARSFGAVYSDPDGALDIGSANLLINATLNSANALWGYYDSPTNKLYLKNDAGTALIGGFAPGSASVITNSQGSLNCANTVVARSGNNLTIYWNMTPSSSFVGTKNLYLYVKDSANAIDGFDDLGDWLVKSSTNTAPTLVSLAPANSANIVNTPRSFGAVYSDADGALDITSVQFIINATLTQANGLVPSYDPATDKLFLKNDAGTALIGGFTPGSANVISNSQGSLNCANTVVVRNGNTLTVYWNVTPSASFVGVKNLYQYVRDASNASAGFTDMGDWLVKTSSNVAPTVVSVTPSVSTSATGVAKSLSAVYSDADNALDITSVQFIVNSTLTQVNGLAATYDLATNKLFLKNDAGTTLIGGFEPGSANVISNSQGTLNCAATTVTRSGNNLTVNWNFTPASSFTGTKNLYLFVKDTSNASAGFTDLGDWTISAGMAPMTAPASKEPSGGSS